MRLLVLTLALFMTAQLGAQHAQHGAVRRHAEKPWQAWDGVAGQWIDLEQFWIQYANRKGGLTWGRATDYPAFAKVKEGDTFLVELAQGPCLMEFFHDRWRRANDVQRWNDAFNDFAGCPHVFD